MEIRTEDYEKLGKFYLGREYDIGEKEKTINHSSLPLTWAQLMRVVNG